MHNAAETASARDSKVVSVNFLIESCGWIFRPIKFAEIFTREGVVVGNIFLKIRSLHSFADFVTHSAAILNLNSREKTEKHSLITDQTRYFLCFSYIANLNCNSPFRVHWKAWHAVGTKRKPSKENRKWRPCISTLIPSLNTLINVDLLNLYYKKNNYNLLLTIITVEQAILRFLLVIITVIPFSQNWKNTRDVEFNGF